MLRKSKGSNRREYLKEEKQKFKHFRVCVFFFFILAAWVCKIVLLKLFDFIASLYSFVFFPLSPNRLPLWSGFWTMKKGFGRGVCFGRWRSGTEKGNGRNRTKIRISVLSFSVQGKILFLYREALKRCFNGVKYCNGSLFNLYVSVF